MLLTDAQRAVLAEVALAAAKLRLRGEQPSPGRRTSVGLERSSSGNGLVRSAEGAGAQGSRIDELSKAGLLRCPTCDGAIVAKAQGEQHQGLGGAITLCCAGGGRCQLCATR